MDFSSTVNLISSIIFYAVAGIVSILSAFALYLINKHGEQQSFAVTVSIIYIMLFLILLTNAYIALQTLYA